MTNLGVKGAKRSVKMWTTNFYKSFSKNILLSISMIWLSKIRSVHNWRYVIPRTVYSGWICITFQCGKFLSKRRHNLMENNETSTEYIIILPKNWYLGIQCIYLVLKAMNLMKYNSTSKIYLLSWDDLRSAPRLEFRIT